MGSRIITSGLSDNTWGAKTWGSFKKIALVALVALPLASCNTTSRGLNLVGDEQAEKLGADAWTQIKSETRASTNQAMIQRAQGIANKLLIAAGENPAAWDVQVFQGNEVNAFALPGRKIGVYEGMMNLATTDAMLAAVIGHEIAHVELAHSQSRMSNEMAANVGVGVAGAVLGNGWGQMLGLGAQYGLLMPYGRSQELEADRDGLFTMAKAGYDPREAITLWEKMSAQGGSGPAFLSTHPGHNDRIAQFKSLMPQALAIYQGKR